MNEHRGYSIDRKPAASAVVPSVAAPSVDAGVDLPPTPAISRDELLVPIDESLSTSTEPETQDLTEIAADAVAEPASSAADLPIDDPLPGALPGDDNRL